MERRTTTSVMCVCGLSSLFFPLWCCQVHFEFSHPFQLFILKKGQKFEKQKKWSKYHKETERKGPSSRHDKERPCIQVRKGSGRDGEREKRKEGSFAKSGLWIKCYSFINSQKCKKDLGVYNALKSHRRKKEMNSTHLLSGLPLKKKKKADKCC